jgi:hypothetical protein
MRAWLRLGGLLIALGAAGACSSDAGKVTPSGGGGAGGSGGGGAGGGLAGCLDAPGALDRPPNGQLPCELLPPGLRL